MLQLDCTACPSPSYLTFAWFCLYWHCSYCSFCLKHPSCPASIYSNVAHPLESYTNASSRKWYWWTLVGSNSYHVHYWNIDINFHFSWFWQFLSCIMVFSIHSSLASVLIAPLKSLLEITTNFLLPNSIVFYVSSPFFELSAPSDIADHYLPLYLKIFIMKWFTHIRIYMKYIFYLHFEERHRLKYRTLTLRHLCVSLILVSLS